MTYKQKSAPRPLFGLGALFQFIVLSIECLANLVELLDDREDEEG